MGDNMRLERQRHHHILQYWVHDRLPPREYQLIRGQLKHTLVGWDATVLHTC
jgi:hypothetical protein